MCGPAARASALPLQLNRLLSELRRKERVDSLEDGGQVHQRCIALRHRESRGASANRCVTSGGRPQRPNACHRGGDRRTYVRERLGVQAPSLLYATPRREDRRCPSASTRLWRPEATKNPPPASSADRPAAPASSTRRRCTRRLGVRADGGGIDTVRGREHDVRRDHFAGAQARHVRARHLREHHDDARIAGVGGAVDDAGPVDPTTLRAAACHQRTDDKRKPRIRFIGAL